MYKKKTQVHCKKCGYVDIDDTKFLNIEEDYKGADLYYFICKKCGKKGKSNIYT